MIFYLSDKISLTPGFRFDIWGEVSNGDRIFYYIPQHQLNSSLSFITDKIDIKHK